MIEACISSSIVALTLLIGLYVMLKRYVEQLRFDVFNDVLEWAKSEDGAKFIYSIGALIGNGAKAGFGLQKRGGKFGMQDLAMQIIGKYLGIGGETDMSQNEPIEQPQDVQRQNVKYGKY